MDKAQAKQLASQYIALLVKYNYKVKAAFLFGSYTKNAYDTDSDIDLAIVLDGTFDEFDEQVRLMKLRRQIDLRIEPHPFSSHDFNLTNPYAREILATGEAI